MEEHKGTAVILTCRCGWMGVGYNFGLVADEYAAHSAGRSGHKDERYTPVSNPVFPEAVALFKKCATVRGDESRALDYLERWKGWNIGDGCERVPATEFGNISEAFRRFSLSCAVIGMGVLACLAYWWTR